MYGGYQPMYNAWPNNMMYQPSPQQTSTNNASGIQGVTFVNGFAEAQSINVLPFGTRVLCMDTDLDRFYIVTSKSSGIPDVDMYDFVKVEEAEQSNYVTREEFNKLVESLRSPDEPVSAEPQHGEEPSTQAGKHVAAKL